VRFLRTVLVVATVVAASGAVCIGTAAASPDSPDAPVPGTFVAVAPFRAAATTIVSGSTSSVRVSGRGAVPEQVAAVALTLTASSSTSGGLIAYGTGTARPGVRTLLFPAGRAASTSAIVRVPPSGRIDVFNAARFGSARVSVDVSGYYVAGPPSARTPGVFRALTPAHVLAARSLGPRRTLTVGVGGHAGVPSSGVGGVAVVLRALSPARAGELVTFRPGTAPPRAATTSFAASQAASGFGLVPSDDAGRIAIYNASRGPVRVAVDVVGWVVGGQVRSVGATQFGTPSRVLPESPLRPGRSVDVTVAQPGSASAALVAIRVSGAAATGAVVAWRAGSARPATVSLRFGPGHVAIATALVPVSFDGAISVHNLSAGAVRLAVDALGYVRATTAPLTAPHPSTGRYIRTIGQAGDAFADRGTTGDGCVDATAGSTLVLLEFGAQLNDTTGVELSATTIIVSYQVLVAAIDNYLASFALCHDSGTVTIALGTNNDGDFTVFPAAARGTAWADEVVDAVTVPAGIRVVGANDIEQGFASTQEQAQAWEAGYLAATDAGLLFTGSADGCPTAPGSPGEPCAYWTEQQIYDLAHNGTRVQVLPQVYTPEQAVQWANIDATGGGGLEFAGVLTESQACPVASTACPTASYRPADGWLALYHALDVVVDVPSIPEATDLRADG
jgi:hypothetical protein